MGLLLKLALVVSAGYYGKLLPEAEAKVYEAILIIERREALKLVSNDITRRKYQGADKQGGDNKSGEGAGDLGSLRRSGAEEDEDPELAYKIS